MLGRKSFASSLGQFETLYAVTLVLPSFPVRFIDAGEQLVDSSESFLCETDKCLRTARWSQVHCCVVGVVFPESISIDLHNCTSQMCHLRTSTQCFEVTNYHCNLNE